MPHALSNFSAINNIYLCRNHNLVWSEIITCGRKLSGEEFQFTRYHNLTNIYINKKLVVKENVLLEPLKKDPSSIGQLEGYTHQATLIFLNDHLDMKDIMQQRRELLSGSDDILFGISRLPVNGLISRQLGYKTEQLFSNNNKLAELISRFEGRSLRSFQLAFLWNKIGGVFEIDSIISSL